MKLLKISSIIIFLFGTMAFMSNVSAGENGFKVATLKKCTHDTQCGFNRICNNGMCAGQQAVHPR